MKSLKDVENSVTQFNVNPRSEMRSRVLDEALDIQRGRKQKSTSDIYVWTKIMRSQIGKLAVAAVVIVAVMLGVDQFWGTVDSTSVAWAKVAEKMDPLPACVHRQKRVALSDGKEIPFLRSDVVHTTLPSTECVKTCTMKTGFHCTRFIFFGRRRRQSQFNLL